MGHRDHERDTVQMVRGLPAVMERSDDVGMAGGRKAGGRRDIEGVRQDKGL
jgi:hypothetical protein